MGDWIDAIVRQVQLASTQGDVAGGAALTWGRAGWGGDISRVQEQLVRVLKLVGACPQDPGSRTWCF